MPPSTLRPLPLRPQHPSFFLYLGTDDVNEFKRPHNNPTHHSHFATKERLCYLPECWVGFFWGGMTGARTTNANSSVGQAEDGRFLPAAPGALRGTAHIGAGPRHQDVDGGAGGMPCWVFPMVTWEKSSDGHKLPLERPAGFLWGRAPQKTEPPGYEMRQPLLRSLPSQGGTVRVVQLAVFLEG